MREIEFRAWDLISNGWRYFGVMDSSLSDELDIGGLVDLDWKTLGQFTGLTDRDEKKIFEGDIVQYYLFVHDHRGRIRVKESYRDSDVVTFEDGKFILPPKPWEVIGNIHEANLIKGEA